jgi:hypothetical protein
MFPPSHPNDLWCPQDGKMKSGRPKAVFKHTFLRLCTSRKTKIKSLERKVEKHRRHTTSCGHRESTGAAHCLLSHPGPHQLITKGAQQAHREGLGHAHPVPKGAELSGSKSASLNSRPQLPHLQDEGLGVYQGLKTTSH